MPCEELTRHSAVSRVLFSSTCDIVISSPAPAVRRPKGRQRCSCIVAWGQSTPASGCGKSSVPHGDSSESSSASALRPARRNSRSTHSGDERQEAGGAADIPGTSVPNSQRRYACLAAASSDAPKSSSPASPSTSSSSSSSPSSPSSPSSLPAAAATLSSSSPAFFEASSPPPPAAAAAPELSDRRRPPLLASEAPGARGAGRRCGFGASVGSQAQATRGGLGTPTHRRQPTSRARATKRRAA
mmetsp:Transcript_128327/g.411260  ORF Transcript_128327/g.411260 Transcript_128327/m.411260 type:complete len:243 (+) Transcript_128327:415-1143(+)